MPLRDGKNKDTISDNIFFSGPSLRLCDLGQPSLLIFFVHRDPDFLY